jgi:hypothetical protein
MSLTDKTSTKEQPMPEQNSSSEKSKRTARHQYGKCLAQPPKGWLLMEVYFQVGPCSGPAAGTQCNTMDIVEWDSPSFAPGDKLDLSLQFYMKPDGWDETQRYHRPNNCDNTPADLPNRVWIIKK